MEPEAPFDPKRTTGPAEPVTKDETIDEVLTPAGAEAVSPAVPAEAVVPSPPTDEAAGPSIPAEAFRELDPAETLAAVVAADLPPGTVEVASPPSPAAPADDVPGPGNRTGAVILEWPHPTSGLAATGPQSLRAAVNVMLASGFPMLIMWGPEGTQLYNDACRSVLGATRPQAGVGQHSSPCWVEICGTLLEPMFQQVMSGGKEVWIEDLPLAVDRSGYVEEAYFTFSCGAIRDETGDPIGMLATFVETTGRVLSERRLRMLGELAAHASAARTSDATCRDIAGTLETQENDIPFFLLYLVDTDGRRARLCASAGVAPGSSASPEIVDLSPAHDADVVWPIGRVTRTGQIEECADLTALAGSLARGPWSEDVHVALAVPIMSSGQPVPMGALVAGISPRRALDEDYRRFLDLVGGQIATAFSNARAYEAERRHGETLEALDREKTAFFTRVGDEFRAPLTEMLGPASDLLAGTHGPLSDGQREQVAGLHSNAVHLLKLADTLLTFLRIGAGRVDPSFEPTDLAGFTGEIAGAFRPVVERAGLALTIDCQPLPEPVYVDRSMWERIVLHLMSNALKFTFEGRIGVALHASDGCAELVVSDTGTGIAAEHIPHVFRRFYRIPDARGRTPEGSGLGLALVNELVQVHGGSVNVTSEPGAGTSFRVRLLMGHAHLPDDRVVRGGGGDATPARAAAFVEDADRWLSAPSERTDRRVEGPAPSERTGRRVEGHDRAPADEIEPRDAFFAAASHELRDPIHSLQLQLLALTRRAEREVAGPEHEWIRVRLGKATKQLARLNRLVDTLLDVSRIASGRLPLALEEVDLAEIVSDAFERLDAAEQAHIRVSLSPAIGRWDRVRLDQVVTNLVSNALKYGEGQPIEIVVREREGRARLEVTDHGIGIAPHHQERVFERFERAVSDRRYSGFGLGLWITSRIVEEFGGTLSLRSELGVGSTFIVELPRHS
jgi:signal transduction histidine kinase